MVRSADRKGIGRSHGAGACAEPLEPRLFLHAVSPAPLPTIRINVGGATPFTDSAGNVWEADRGFTGGTASRSSYGVANTTDDRLYYERRWGPFTYSLPVDNGDYTLSLLFADPVYTAAGQRKFDVSAEGRQVLNDFDIAASGGGKAAISRSFDVTVADGALSLSFTRVVENPIVSGIQLVPRETQTPPPFPWTAGTPIPVGRHEAGVAVANGQVYVFGGYFNTSIDATRRVDRYDLAADRWTRLADMPEAITHAGVAVDGDTVWVVGGFVGDNPGPSTSHVWKYDVSENAWTAGPALPAARAAGGLVKVGRTLHYFSGLGAGDMYTAPDEADHYVLDLDGGTRWTSGAPLPNPRNHIGAAEVGGKIYAIGGQRGGGEEGEKSGNEDDVQVYDPATDRWSSRAPMPFGRGHINGSTFVMNGRIVVAGGVKNGPAALRDVIEYDPPTDTWVALPPLPAPRQAGVAALVGDRIVFTGGETGGARPQPDTWVGVLHNRWETAASMPTSLGEVAGGVVRNKLYLVGEGSGTTLVHDLSTNSWSTAAARPHVGDHHAAEVYNGKLYLFGGFNGGSSGKVQIYNPSRNSWSLGNAMPFNAGSVSAVRIGQWVYVAGGIVDFVQGHGGTTTNQFARYHLLHNKWMRLPAMPRGVNHAAAATDGRRVYVFGGRAGHGGVEDGFNTVQVYDTVSRSWRSSDVSGSGVVPLPQARGGTGRAVYLNGEFYVLGGETRTGGGATDDRVYNRVDVYNPATNRWRLGPAMPTARHGIYPLLHAGRIYVAGGGTVAGFSRSNILEILNAD
ncbi:MAG TPA: kelch repeat-containing protein [Tepidisphaeraceae bacterium]|nr:kelch repeat-containing protein [Tepidisphaeraceae bacterium]